MNSVKIVEDFWTAVWKARNPDAIRDFVVDDFIITTGGTDVVGREKFIEWAWGFLEKINDFEFEVLETFQNEDGSRVASLWRVTGRNNGMLGTPRIKSRSPSQVQRSGMSAVMASCFVTGSSEPHGRRSSN